jgi:SAM-dependent MidA family methyltransferase
MLPAIRSGREGDFTTSPEVSQMFGELLGCGRRRYGRRIGSPSVLRLIETRTRPRHHDSGCAARALRVLPPLYQSLSIHLVEINPVLREKQKSTLAECAILPGTSASTTCPAVLR